MEGEQRIDHALAGRSAVERATERAGRQFGAIARRQLLEMGNTASRIDHWMQAGRLHPKYPGVYAWGRADLSVEGELAADLLYAGPGAALTGITALWWMDLLHRRPRLTHIATPSRRSAPSGIRLVEAGAFERRAWRGLPVVALPLALLAATADLSHDSLRLVLARAEFERTLDRPALEQMLRGGRRGTVALRAALDAHLPQLARCVNGFEREFVLLCERFRLPLPEPNPRIGRYRPDMLWRSRRLIVELDGAGAHSTPAQLAADAQRQAALEAMGYSVLRFGWAEIELEPERVAATLRRRLPEG
jgi:hypothetical protein